MLLATPDDLRNLLGEDTESLTDPEADLLLELASSAVRAAAGQMLTATSDDEVTLMGTTGSWLVLPEQPVTGISSVEVDGEPVNDYTRFGARLWRDAGWADHPSRPMPVTVVYDHGYIDGDEELGLARSVTLAIAAQSYSNPTGATGFSVDDYREQYSQSTESDLSGTVPARLRAALRRRYGARGGLVRVG